MMEEMMIFLKAANVFRGMIERCYKQDSSRYLNYGGRGIYVSDEWISDPTQFFNWYKENYFDNCQVDRIDNNGPYSKENCRTATVGQNNRNRRVSRYITAFGETKIAADWVNDPRCNVDIWRTISWRIKNGWNAEDAITTAPNTNKKIYRKTDEERIKTSFIKRPKRKISAFGEEKFAKDWIKDARCHIDNVETLSARIRRGVDPELAMSKDYKEDKYSRVSKTQRSTAPQIEAFGESKSLADWAEDSRCTVAKNTLWDRIERGWNPEEAITTPGRLIRNYGNIEAFGESKSVAEWAADERCLPAYSTLTKRLANGWTPEEAMTTAPVRGKKSNMV